MQIIANQKANLARLKPVETAPLTPQPRLHMAPDHTEVAVLSASQLDDLGG